MSNPYLTKSFNKYRNKIRGNMKTSFSISPNIKITQYLERKKNVIHHKSPSNMLNKSQNIRENQKILKINLKNYIINKKLNKKKFSQNKKLRHNNRKSNSINPINSNFSIKLNSMNSLPGCFINNNTTYYINNNTNNNNNINNISNTNTGNINNINNKTLSKNNSLSYYYTSNCNMVNNYKGKNIGKIINENALQKLLCMKANMSYYTNFNFNKGYINKTIKKNQATNLTTDNSNSRNMKSPSGKYFITEETKLCTKEKRKIKSKSKPKTSYTNNKKSKKKNSNNIINKIKSNKPIKIPHKNSYQRPQMNFLGGDACTDKNIYSPNIESIELKIAKQLQNIKNLEKVTKFGKLKSTCEEAIENFVPKEYQKMFYIMIKEFDNINKINLNDIKYLKDKKDELNKKIKIIENENNIYKLQLEQNNKEMISIKNQLKQVKNNNMNFPYKNQKNIKSIKNNNKNNKDNFQKEEMNYENLNIETDSNYIIKNIKKRNSEINCIIDNNYFTQLNKRNLNDLDAIYFFDKITNNNIDSNMKNNKIELIPELNLDPDYIEKCKEKELLKMEEEHLTPFQRIALHFESS